MEKPWFYISMTILVGGIIFGIIDCAKKSDERFHESVRVCIQQGCSVIQQQCICPGVELRGQ